MNAALEGQAFLCVGPGRWGTVNFDLGVNVGYADICNSRALVELSGEAVEDYRPEHHIEVIMDDEKGLARPPHLIRRNTASFHKGGGDCGLHSNLMSVYD